MDSIKKLQQWKKDLEELNTEKIRAEGRLEQAMSELKALGFETIEGAKAELDRLTKLKETKEREAEETLETFKEKYADYIE